MIITEIKLAKLSIPLAYPFKTAVSYYNNLDNVVVEIHTDTGNIGYGEASPLAAISEDTLVSIITTLRDHISKKLIGKDISDFENIMLILDQSVAKNFAAKAAVDMALYDLYGQLKNVPVYKLLNGEACTLITDYTISIDSPDKMSQNALDAVNRGYNTLKVEVGADPKLDIERLSAIRNTIGYDVNIRIDANQSWSPRQAVRVLNNIQSLNLNIELVEQPVKSYDMGGLKYVTERSYIPVLADESAANLQEALTVVQVQAANFVSLKLLKCGGIFNALKITDSAEVHNIQCMISCVLESKISVTAAAHLACAKSSVITKVDLDSPTLCEIDPIVGGATFDKENIVLSDAPGLGIKEIKNLVYLESSH